ncbi:thioredoxin-1-like isoform X2 [Phragmites australis]|uniref:thioredoxin-1-like isoform X2 n=1 Tax=Phragmites australis TaxID=29695 RepID=UPI002D786663|nr:thioredoxin-1-like isoform X2 [Phragmites australis]
MSRLVKTLRTEEELKNKLKSPEKLVVLEFVKPGNQVCVYVQPEREKIAEDLKEKADFFELDVDEFKKYAEKLQVEALPAFVVMQNFVKKRHVVGTDDLKKAIDEVHATFGRKTQDETAPKDPAERKTQDESAPKDPEPEQTTPGSGSVQRPEPSSRENTTVKQLHEKLVRLISWLVQKNPKREIS